MSEKESYKEERTTYYIASLVATFVSAGVIEIWVMAGEINLLALIDFYPILFILIGAVAEFFAIMNFIEIKEKCFWDYFFLIFVVAGGIGAILGGIVFLIFKVVGGYLKDEFSTPVSSSSSEKPDEYHVGKDSAGYDRIYNQDGREITSIDSVRDDGDIYGTDGNRYTPK